MPGKQAHIAENLRQIQAHIARAENAAGRPAGSVRLLAISKAFDADAIREAVAADQRAFGENYLAEALPKIDALAGLGLEWHFTGPIQSNKTAAIAAHFDWVHGLDRDKIARRLSEQRPESLAPLNVCVQINISGEPSKSGVPPEDAARLCAQVVERPRLRLRGLMAIPAPVQQRAEVRAPYRQLRRLYDALRARGFALDTLSAGTSDDFEAAIAEGATIVRVGRAIFGERPRRP